MPSRVRENGALATNGGGRFLVTIITPGQGSSGFYKQHVLEAAAASKTFPAGTQMHVDHATNSERAESDVRSVKTLAAVLTEDARWDGTALVAEARPIGPWGQTVREAADVIGVSINASANFTVENGARVVEELIPSPLNTIDFVTVPGRGGSFTVLEAARVTEGATVASWLEARTQTSLTSMFADMYGDGRLSKAEWDSLNLAAGDALATLTAAIDALPALREREPWQDATPDSPATEAGNTSTDPAEGKTPNGNPTKEDPLPKIEIDETELAQLRESAGRAETLAQENADLKTAAEQAEKAAREKRAAEAEAVIKEAYGENAPAFLVSAAKYAAEQGTFDAAAAREAAVTLTANEAGNPSGLGTPANESGALPTDADIANAL